MVAKVKLIMDSTHTNAMCQHISPRDELIKERRSYVKQYMRLIGKKAKKRESSGLLEDETAYCHELSAVVEADPGMEVIETVKDR